MCALNLLSVANLVNYFGKPEDIEDISVSPILLRKGTTQLSLYGLGSVRDERLHRLFLRSKVKFLRPKEQSDNWFNLFMLHQNRSAHILIYSDITYNIMLPRLQYLLIVLPYNNNILKVNNIPLQ